MSRFPEVQVGSFWGNNPLLMSSVVLYTPGPVSGTDEFSLTQTLHSYENIFLSWMTLHHASDTRYASSDLLLLVNNMISLERDRVVLLANVLFAWMTHLACVRVLLFDRNVVLQLSESEALFHVEDSVCREMLAFSTTSHCSVCQMSLEEILSLVDQSI